MARTASRGTCTLWFEYPLIPAMRPDERVEVADHVKAVVAFAEAHGHVVRESSWLATADGSKGPRRVLMVSSELLDGPEMVRRALPLVPNAINLVSASGNGQPTAAESGALRAIRAMTRGVIPVHYAE